MNDLILTIQIPYGLDDLRKAIESIPEYAILRNIEYKGLTKIIMELILDVIPFESLARHDSYWGDNDGSLPIEDLEYIGESLTAFIDGDYIFTDQSTSNNLLDVISDVSKGIRRIIYDLCLTDFINKTISVLDVGDDSITIALIESSIMDDSIFPY